MVKTIDGIAFQGKLAFLSNLADCQIEEGKDSFSSAAVDKQSPTCQRPA